MISFPRLGISYGGLGNQLFQYAFLRTTARRLGVKFYCPRWMGDEFFILNDGNERARKPAGIHNIYRAEEENAGYAEDALRIEDGTEIEGHFQSEKCLLNPELVRQWYTFKEEKISAVKEKYRHINFSESVSIHLRLGDMKFLKHFYVAPVAYYKRSLSKVKHKENVLIFSDEIEAAKKMLKGLKEKITYMEGNEDYEDLYLVSKCHDNICSISTLSWWGAWLNGHIDKTVAVPKEGGVRPGFKVKISSFWPEKWMKVRALRPLLDDYRVVVAKNHALNLLKPFSKITTSYKKNNG